MNIKKLETFYDGILNIKFKSIHNYILYILYAMLTQHYCDDYTIIVFITYILFILYGNDLSSKICSYIVL